MMWTGTRITDLTIIFLPPPPMQCNVTRYNTFGAVLQLPIIHLHPNQPLPLTPRHELPKQSILKNNGKIPDFYSCPKISKFSWKTAPTRIVNAVPSHSLWKDHCDGVAIIKCIKFHQMSLVVSLKGHGEGGGGMGSCHISSSKVIKDQARPTNQTRNIALWSTSM